MEQVLEKSAPVWAVTPKGRVTIMPMRIWDNGLGSEVKNGRKFQAGWRLANSEEVLEQERLIEEAHKKQAEKNIQKIQIVNGQMPAVPVSLSTFSYPEMRAIAKKRGIKTFGKTKEVLAKELGLM